MDWGREGKRSIRSHHSNPTERQSGLEPRSSHQQRGGACAVLSWPLSLTPPPGVSPFLQLTKLAPTSGPWHVLFPPPRTVLPLYTTMTASLPHLLALVKRHLLKETSLAPCPSQTSPSHLSVPGFCLILLLRVLVTLCTFTCFFPASLSTISRTWFPCPLPGTLLVLDTQQALRKHVLDEQLWCAGGTDEWWLIRG